MKNRFLSAVFRSSIFVALSQVAWAADLYWDANGTTAGTGGTGTWNGTSTSTWRSGSETGGLVKWTAGDTAFFGGTAGTVTLGSPVAAGGIQVLAGTSGSAYTLVTTTTNIVTPGANAPIAIATGKSLVVRGAASGAVLGGSATIVIQGGGTMSITGTNRVFAGNYKVSGTGTTLVVNGTNALDASNVSAGLEVLGGGVVQVNGTNNYRKTVVLDGGRFDCMHIRSLQAQANSLMTINGSNGVRSVVANAATADLGGLAGNGSTTRVIAVNATGDPGGVDLEYQAGWRNGTFNKSGAGTLWITPTAVFNRNDNYTTANNTSASLAVNAGTVLNEGTIMSPASVSGTGLLRAGGTAGVFDQIDLNTGGVFEISRTDGLFNDAFVHAAGKANLNFGGGTLRYATGFNVDVSGWLSAIPAAGGVLDSNGNDLTWASPLSGVGALTKTGSGALTLSGSHTLAGMTVETGSLKLAAGASVQGMSVRLKGTGQLDAGEGTVFDGAALANEDGEGGRTVVDVTGDLTVAAGSVIRPGGRNAVFAMAFGGDLVLNGTCELDLTDGVPGLDRIQVAGDLDVSQGSFAIQLGTAVPMGGVVASYGGVLSGVPKLSGYVADSRYEPTLAHDPVAKTLALSIAAGKAPLALVWSGGEGSAWDLTTAERNFVRSGGVVLDTFRQLDQVSFGDTAGSKQVVLTGELAPGSLAFNHTVEYTLGGSGWIAGNTSLLKEGSGILNLNTENTYSGGTTVLAGVLNVGNGGTTGSLGSGPILNDGVLAFNRSADLTLGSVISGNGSLSFNGGAVYTLAESNNYAGGTTVLGGTLRQGRAGAIPAPSEGTSSVTVAAGGSLDLGGYALAGTAALPVVVAGNGVAANQGAVVNSGGNLVGSGIAFLTLAGDASLGSDGARFDLVGTGGAGGILSTDPLVPRKFTKVGSNQISLKTDDYSGVSEFVVAGGVLGVEHDNFSSPTRTVTIEPAGALSLWGGRTLANPFVLRGGSLRADNATTNLVSGDVQLAADSTVVAASGTALSLSGVVSGDGRLTKDGVGDLTLGNANTYTGGTTLLGTGRLLVNDSHALGTGGLELAGGAASQLTLAASGITLSQSIVIKSGGRVNEGLIYANQAGTTTLAGDITVQGGHNAGGTLGSVASAELVLAGKVVQTMQGLDLQQPTLVSPIRVAVRNGTVRFDNPANDFRWLFLSEGILKVGADHAFSTGAIVTLGDNTNGAVLELNGFDQEVRSLARWGSTGATTIRNTGSEPSILTFNTDFTGHHQVETILAVGDSVRDGSVTVTVTGADFASAPVVLEVPVLAGDSADVWAEKVRAALAADAVVTGNYQVAGSGNQISLVRKVAAANDATLNLALANGATSPGITADATSENAVPGVFPFYAGAISGEISVRKTGPESLTLSGTHTHSGTTTVSQGKLIFNATHSGGGDYSIAAGATLAGSGSTTSKVQVGGVLSPGDDPGLGSIRCGDLSLGDGAKLVLNINTTEIAADYLRVDGNVSLGTGVMLELSDVKPDPGLALGTRLLLAGYTGTWSGSLMHNGMAVADDSTLQIGTHRFLVNYDDVGSDTARAVTLTAVPGVTDPYQDWMNGYPAVPEGLRGKEIDADGDGVINLVEFALGSDPSLASSAPNRAPILVDGEGGAKHLALVTLVRAGAQFAGSPPAAMVDGVNYLVQGSDNLGAFEAAVESVANPAELPAAPAGYEYRTFRLVSPVTAAARGFLRVKVSGGAP